MATNDESEPYPVLTRWLEGAPTANVWSQMLVDGRPDSPALLRPMECILASLDAAQPLRLAGKRRAFRNDLDETNALNLRVELLVGAKLAEAGIKFGFGGQGAPDFTCVTSIEEQISLEVTTRAKDDLARLHDELEHLLAGVPVKVEVSAPRRPLALPASDRRVMGERILAACAALPSDGHASVPLPEIDGLSICRGTLPVGPGRVILNLGPALGDHLDEVTRELFNVMALKTEQFSRNGWQRATLLVVDPTRLGLSWIRPESVWLGILAQLMIDWTALPFLGLVVGFSSLDSTRFGGASIVRPDATAEELSAANQVLAAFEIGPLGAAGS
jgi:hypothetical protein